MTELQGVLFCGGSGSRMTEISDHIPKCLLPVAGVPMFWYPLNTLAATGVRDVKLFVRSSVAPQIHHLLGTAPFKFDCLTVEVICIPRENEEWGTADVLRYHAAKINKDFVVISDDFVSDASLQPVVDQFRAHKATFSCLLSEYCVSGLVPGPKVKRSKGRDLVALCETSNRLVFISSEEDFDTAINIIPWSEKFARLTLTARYNDCHVYFMQHSTLQMLQKQKKLSSLKADFLPYLLSQQCLDAITVKCMAYVIPRVDATIMAHANNIGAYFEVNKAILKSLPRISPRLCSGQSFNYKETGISVGESLVANGAKINSRVVIKRSLIGDKCHVDEKTRIQGSLIMEDVRIGKCVNISQSIICTGVEIEDNAEVINCIVACGQKIAAKSKVQDEIIEADDNNEWTTG